MRPVALVAVFAVAAVGLAVAGPSAAQPATGSYVPVATWEDTASTLPSGVWADPAGIELTASGRLFVVDRRLRRVEELDASGNPVGTFGRAGSPEDLVAPEHVAVDEVRDRVYVTDPGALRLAVYTTAGAPVARWTNVGAPAGVAVAPDGRIVTTDTDGDQVHVLATDGREVARWGGTGTGNTQLDAPGGIHVAADGTVWVADRGNGRLVGASLDGQPVNTIRLIAPQLAGAEPLDVTVVENALWIATDAGLGRFALSGMSRGLTGLLPDAAASAVTADAAHGLFAVVTAAEGPPGVWRYLHQQASGDPQDRWGAELMVPGYFDGVEALTVGDDGQVYLLDVPARVQRLSPAGVVTGQLLAPDPVEVDADAAGQVFAAAGDTLYALAADGTERWRARVRPPGSGVEVDLAGVGWDAANTRVLVLDSGSRRCFAIDPTGAELSNWAPRSRDSAAQYWADLAVGADGTFYLLDAGNAQVRGWDLPGRTVLELDVPLGATRFDLVPDGSVVVLTTDGWAHRLGRDGTVIAAWDVTRFDRGQGSRPVDIAVDAAGRVLVADGLADIVTVYDWDAAAPPTSPSAVAEGCQVSGDKRAAPAELELGETIEVSLVVRGQCASTRQLADIALLIDTTLDRSLLKAARSSAEHFIDLVNPATDRVVVQPDAPGGRLTNDVQYLRRLIRRIETTEGYGLGGAITAAEQELYTRRGRPNAHKVIVLLFGSSRDDETEWWQWYWIQRAAGQAKRRGVEIYAIAFGRRTDVQLLYDIASGRDHVYQSKGTWQLDTIYRQVAGEIKPSVLLGELTISDEIPANMAYVEGSAVPPAVLRDRTLIWHLTAVPLGGTGVRYRLRPLEAGDWPTNVRAEGTWVDPQAKPGRLDFPVPIVRVRAPTATPTSTPPPTATSTVTTTPTASATAPPTASPTSRPSALYLPLVLREHCDPVKRRADVVLAIDASTSMGEPTSANRTKLAAATEAARAFLDQLDLAHDRAAVVTFNDEATTLQVLTDDRAALDAALGRIVMARTTRLDLGIAAARAELSSARRRADSQPAMVVLTDGRANPVGPAAAVAEAALAKGAGVIVFTVGVGDDLDLEALRAIASQPDFFYQTVDAEDLTAIYAQIATRIPCPASAFWGHRRE